MSRGRDAPLSESGNAVGRNIHRRGVRSLPERVRRAGKGGKGEWAKSTPADVPVEFGEGLSGGMVKR
ncbi:MAG: hypothetical protein H0U65_14105 [Rubrobacter sp.]|nr:hypothetical protein [Rubrobacter sp.]